MKVPPLPPQSLDIISPHPPPSITVNQIKDSELRDVAVNVVQVNYLDENFRVYCYHQG